jgi:hypothetical protein
MKKLIGMVVLAMVLAAGISPVQAMGPLMVAAHTAAWDRSADAKVTGYYLYYRAQGVTAWSNGQRSAVVPQPAAGVSPTLDILTLVTANGNYELAVTARNAAGDESGPSNIVPFVVEIPAAQTNLKVQ